MNGDSFKVGDRISENGKKGTVVAIHSKGTVDVQFDDMDYAIRRQLGSVSRINPRQLLRLYHRTSPTAAAQIYRTGKWKTKILTSMGSEIYFSTFGASEQGGYGKGLVAIDIPEQYAYLDDEFPSGEQHYWVEKRELERHGKLIPIRTNPSRKAEIQQMINTAPPAWKQMFKRYKLGNKPTVDKLIETVLEYTPSMRKYGDRGDAAHTPPKKVRDEAMKGVVLSHRHNYTSASGIGLVRAMQLVVKPKIWDRSVQRMSSYFERHIRDQESANFGNDKNPSRGYMAWLNWGGDSGKDWADNIVNRHSVSNPAPGYQSWQWRQQDWRSVIISGSKIDYSKKCGAAGTKLKNGKPRLCLPLLALDELIKTPSGRKILRAQARKKEKAKKGERVPWHPEIKRLHRLAEQGIEEDDPRKRANPIALNSYSTPYKEEDMSYTELDSLHRSTKMAIIYRRNSALVPSMADRTPQEGKLTAAERASFPKKAFVFPSRAPGPGSYPIPNIHYAKLALNMASWSEKGKEELPEILPIVLKKYPQLKNWSHIDRYYDIADEEGGYALAANPSHKKRYPMGEGGYTVHDMGSAWQRDFDTALQVAHQCGKHEEFLESYNYYKSVGMPEQMAIAEALMENDCLGYKMVPTRGGSRATGRRRKSLRTGEEYFAWKGPKKRRRRGTNSHQSRFSSFGGSGLHNPQRGTMVGLTARLERLLDQVLWKLSEYADGDRINVDDVSDAELWKLHAGIEGLLEERTADGKPWRVGAKMVPRHGWPQMTRTQRQLLIIGGDAIGRKFEKDGDIDYQGFSKRTEGDWGIPPLTRNPRSYQRRSNMASKKHGVAELKEAYRKEHGPQWFLLPKVYATYKNEKKELQTQGRAAARAKSGKGSTKGESIALTGTTGYDCYPRKSNPSIRVEVRGVRSPYHLVAIEPPLTKTERTRMMRSLSPRARAEYGAPSEHSLLYTFDQRYRTKKEAQAAAKELRAFIRDGGDWRSLDSMSRFNPKKKRKVASKRRSTAKRKTRKPTAVACPKCKRKTHTWNSFLRAHAGMYTQTQLSRHWKQYKRKHGRK